IPSIPHTTLFPYTTLFRSHSFEYMLPCGEAVESRANIDFARANKGNWAKWMSPFRTEHRPLEVVQLSASHTELSQVAPKGNIERSEEHTSELQSRFDLVCR